MNSLGQRGADGRSHTEVWEVCLVREEDEEEEEEEAKKGGERESENVSIRR